MCDAIHFNLLLSRPPGAVCELYMVESYDTIQYGHFTVRSDAADKKPP